MYKVPDEDEFRLKVIEHAKYFVDNDVTVRQAANVFGINKTTFHLHITKYLERYDVNYNGTSLYEQVREILDAHTKEAPYTAAKESCKSFIKRNYKYTRGILIDLDYDCNIRFGLHYATLSNHQIDDAIAIAISNNSTFVTDEKFDMCKNPLEILRDNRFFDMSANNIIGKVIKQNRRDSSIKIRVTDKEWIDYISDCVRNNKPLPTLKVRAHIVYNVINIICFDIQK